MHALLRGLLSLRRHIQEDEVRREQQVYTTR